MESFSELNQLIFLIVGIAGLFLLVFWNTKRNKNKRFNRKNRDFRKNYYDKKKEK